MDHPYADLIGLRVERHESGKSKCFISVTEKLLNPHRVVHGGVLYSLADTGMGAALYPLLSKGELCATIEIKINYYAPVFSGEITCTSRVIYKGKSVANLESDILADNKLVAKANGNYAIFRLSEKQRN